MKIAFINAEGSALSVDIEVIEVLALAEAFGALPRQIEVEQDTQLSLLDMLNNMETNPFLPMAVQTIENTGDVEPYVFAEADEPAFFPNDRVVVIETNRHGVPEGFVGTIDSSRDSDGEYWIRFDDELPDGTHVDYVAEESLEAYVEPVEDDLWDLYDDLYDFALIEDAAEEAEIEFPHFINPEEVKVIAGVMGNFTSAQTRALGVDPDAHYNLFDCLDDIAEDGNAALLSNVEAQIVVATLGNVPVDGKTFPAYHRLYEAVKENLGIEPIMERNRAISGARPLIGASDVEVVTFETIHIPTVLEVSEKDAKVILAVTAIDSDDDVREARIADAQEHNSQTDPLSIYQINNVLGEDRKLTVEQVQALVAFIDTPSLSSVRQANTDIYEVLSMLDGFIADNA